MKQSEYFFDRKRLVSYNILMNKLIISGIVIFILLFGLIAFMRSKDGAHSDEPGKFDVFAQCLKDSGVKFYGAFWCPHCQAQKKLFGSSERLLPYIECSTPDSQGQTAICKEQKIEGYPTWEFADSTRESGELTLEKLSEKSSCPLPAATSTTPQ